MATNLVSLAMKFLTPELVMKMASALGLDRALATKAVTAAVPAILAGLVGKAAKPDGAKSVFDTVAKQDSSLLGNLASMVGGSGQSSLISQGTSALTSLLGGSAVGGLTSALTKYAGIGEGPTKSLLGMLASTVLGAIGQEQRANKLDAGGLANLLSSQKSNIASALPGDFAKLLGPTGLLDQIPAAKNGTSTVPAASVTPARKVEPPPRTGVPVASATRTTTTGMTPVVTSPLPSAPWWRLPLIAAALLGLGWSLYGVNPTSTTITTSPATTSTQRIVVDGVDVGGQVTTVLDSLRTTLGSIRDVGTAQAAVAKLTDAGTQLDRVTALAAKMSPETRRTLAGMVSSGSAGLGPVFTSVLALPGVSAIVKPAIDGVRAKLDVLSKG